MKVNISNSQHKKSHFGWSLDSSTTANFGEVIPNFCHEIVPNTTLSVSQRDAVRFAPLSFPTFGKAFLHTYFYSHKISDLYPPFNDMLARTPYTSGSGNIYNPTKVPSLPLYMLWLSVLSNCSFTFYGTNFKDISNVDNFKFTNLSLVPIDQIEDENGYIIDNLDYTLPYLLLQSLYHGNASLSGNTNTFPSALKYIDYIKNHNNANQDFLFTSSDGSNYGNTYISYNNSDRITPVDVRNSDYIFYMPESFSSYLRFDKVSNLIKVVSGNLIFRNSVDSSTFSDVIVCMRLNDSGKFLRKILMGLGYQIAPLDTEVSILPIYAYFKSYFETFAPKRFVKFEQSYFARLINSCVNSGLNIDDVITSFSTSYSSVIRWNNIIDDLLSCYYTRDTDYYSSQIIGMINDYGSDIYQDYIGEYSQGSGANPSVDTFELTSFMDTNANAGIDFVNNEVLHTQAQQNILSRLTQFINRRSLIGSQIGKLLKSVFGISPKEVEEYNTYVGSSVVDVNFSDVFSTAETAEGSLGEYAGKAVGFGSSDTFRVDSDTHTLVLSMSVIVPRTQYVQGVNPLLTHVGPMDYYNPMFDGLTLLPTRKSALYCGDVLLAHSDNKKSFGNTTIYNEYKNKTCGILSGDLSLRSTKSTYDSFTMDEIISPSDSYVLNSSNEVSEFNNIQYNFDMITNGTMWRYLGRWLWLGRFDRIFVNNRINFSDFIGSYVPNVTHHELSTRNTARTDDNLICHHIIDIKMMSPMVPVPGSWQTDDMLALNDNGVFANGE